MRPNPSALLLLAVALGACDRALAEGDAHLDALPRLVAVAEARIGNFDDPNIGFSRPSAVDVDAEGNVYVVEASVPEIRVYDAEGNLLRRLGGRGGGPGEFEGAPRFGVLGDTVWAVHGSRIWRTTLFDRRGALLATGRTEGVQVPLPGDIGGWLAPFRMRGDGLFTSHFGMVGSAPDSGMDPEGPVPVPVILFDPTGEVVDTIGWTDRPPPRMWRPPSQETASFATVEVAGRSRMVPQAPSILPWWTYLEDSYIAVETPLATAADGGEFTVSRVSFAGDTVYTRTLRYDPIPYAPTSLDSIAARAARGEPGGMVPLAVLAGGVLPPPPDNWQTIATTLRAAMDFPPYRLPLEFAWVAQDGSVWLRRADNDAPIARYTVLAPDGTPRGEVSLPANFNLLWSRGDTVWAVEPDDLDVPWLVRLRIQSE